jgi:hypothetical protein
VQVANDCATLAGVECHSSGSRGVIVARHAQEVAFTLKGDAAAHPAGKLLPFSLEIDLPQGDVYLYVAACDLTSKRLGTLEIPYHVEASKKIKTASQPK